MDAAMPKYYRLKKDIVAMINQEKFAPNEQIPTERELTEKYNFSRITVRKAIDELVNEGYLYRIQGKGTYVKNEGMNPDLFSIVSCTEDIRRMGMTPTRRLLNQCVIPADMKRIHKLELDEGDDVLRISRVYLADDEPVNYTISYINIKLFPGIDKIDFGHTSLYEVLEQKYGARIMHATRTFEAIAVDQNQANVLHMKKGDPVLLLCAVTYGEVNNVEVPIETFKCFYRSDKFKFYINQVR